MKNKYCFKVNNRAINFLYLDKTGHLTILYDSPDGEKGMDKYYDFTGEPEEAAREAARRVELYNREHLQKLGDMEIDYREEPLAPESKE